MWNTQYRQNVVRGKHTIIDSSGKQKQMGIFHDKSNCFKKDNGVRRVRKGKLLANMNDNSKYGKN